MYLFIKTLSYVGCKLNKLIYLVRLFSLFSKVLALCRDEEFIY